ncbi:MAG: hypothetical protein ACI4SG_09050 [Oligosphaeraceae bacterium]
MSESFLDGLLSGVFRVLVEVVPPTSDLSPQALEEIARSMGVEYAGEPWLYGAVVADRPDELERFSPEAFGAAFSREFPRPMVRMLSGKGRTRTQLSDALESGALTAGGYQGVCAASGDALPLEESYVDSVDALTFCRSKCPRILTGATVNVSKYTAPDMALAYAKAARKLSRGARFLLCQAGWDMGKAQELQWLLQIRDTMVPVVARVLWLSRDQMELLPHCLPPGVLLPELHLRALKEAYDQGTEEGRRFQARSLALLMTGFRRLGFSGVLLAGEHTGMDRAALQEEFLLCQEKCPDYDSWLAAWRQENALVMRPPVKNPRYLFAGLLQEHGRDPGHLDFDPTSALDVGKPSWNDRLVSRLLRKASTPTTSPKLRDFLCKLCGVTPRQLPALGALGYLPNAQCPKGLTGGACGNVNGEGECDCREGLCFFRRVLALAAAQGRLPELER